MNVELIIILVVAGLLFYELCMWTINCSEEMSLDEYIKILTKELDNTIVYEYPCYDAPCVKACPHSATYWEINACSNNKCKFWIDVEILENCKKVQNNKECWGFMRDTSIKDEMCSIYKHELEEVSRINKDRKHLIKLMEQQLNYTPICNR